MRNASPYSSSLSSSDVEMEIDDWGVMESTEGVETDSIAETVFTSESEPVADGEPESVLDDLPQPAMIDAPEPAMDEPAPVMADAPEPVLDDEPEVRDDSEPFSTLKPKVIELFQFLWPDTIVDQLVISDMRQGEDSRIISIKVIDMIEIVDEPENEVDNARVKVEFPDYPELPPLPELSGEYILRIQSQELYPPPSWTSSLLRFLKTRLTTPVPNVVWHDNSSCNPLGTSYILQKRLPGRPLHDIWISLSHNQRLMIVQDLASLCRQLMTITNDSAGRPLEDDLAFSPPGASLRTTGYLAFERPDRYRTPIQARDATETVIDRLMHYSYTHGGRGSKQWDETVDTVPYMDDAFGPGPTGASYHITQSHLSTRNILIRTPTSNTAFISGVIDSDDVYFAPPVVAFTPPVWLWTIYGVLGEHSALTREQLLQLCPIPTWGTDMKEIKRLFNTMLGADYMRHAYSVHSLYARSLWALVYGPREDPADDLLGDDVLHTPYLTWHLHCRMALSSEIFAPHIPAGYEFYECARWRRTYTCDDPDRPDQ